MKDQYGSDAVKAWALKVGITSRITFKHILQGRKQLSSRQIKEIEDMLDLGRKDRESLTNPSLAPQEKNLEKFFISPDFFETPINTIILNLCALNRPMNAENIQEILKNSFQSADIDKSILYLLDLKLIQKNEDGSLKRIFHGNLVTLPGIKSSSSREYFKHTYQLADKGWEEPIHLRELSAFTFKINSDDIPKVKDLIRKLRQDINELSNEADNNSLYQCGIAAVPIYIGKES